MGKIQESNPTIEDLQKDVPFIVYEGTQARNERTVKRLITALALTIVLIFASNGAWLYAWLQYDYSGDATETVTVDGESGNANYARDGGSIVNGEDNSCKNDEKDTGTEK